MNPANMKQFLIIFLLCTKLYSQEYTTLDKALKEKYPEKNSFVADGVWMYYPDFGDIKKLSFGNISKIVPNYEFYSVNLTNYLDQHIVDTECLILLNKNDNSVMLVPPVWYGGIDDAFFKLLVGWEFKDKNEIENFIKEVESIILIGSEMHLGKTSYEENKVIIRLILKNHDDTWRTVELNFEKGKFLNVASNRE